MFRFGCHKFPNRFWVLGVVDFQTAGFGFRLLIVGFVFGKSCFGFWFQKSLCFVFGFRKFSDRFLVSWSRGVWFPILFLENQVFRKSCFAFGVRNFPIDYEFRKWSIFKPPISGFVYWLRVSFLANHVSFFGFRIIFSNCFIINLKIRNRFSFLGNVVVQKIDFG